MRRRNVFLRPRMIDVYIGLAGGGIVAAGMLAMSLR
ncbi:hypoxanthine phosphoribosyltransferase [Rhodococcus sp. UYP5]